MLVEQAVSILVGILICHSQLDANAAAVDRCRSTISGLVPRCASALLPLLPESMHLATHLVRAD